MVAETFNEKKLTIDSFTGGEVQGRGIFEELMRTTKAHLVAEYNAKRITGDEYSQVYLASMQAAMAQGSQYLLQYLLTNQQVRLLDQQILDAEKNVELTQAQIDKLKADTLLVNEQITLAQKAALQADQDLATSKKQEDLLDVQIIGAGKDNTLKDSQIAKLAEDTLLVTQNTVNAASQNAVIVNSAAKTLAETAVLNQKLVTEQAQTADTVGGQPVAGIVGRQVTLYTNQAEGYTRDAEQKVAKMFTDMMATRVSVDESTYDLTTAGMQNGDVATVLTTLKAGIGI